MYKTENEIKMVLGLNAWRNLLQDKVVRFAQMMQEIDAGLAMKLASELPQLREFARHTLNRLEKAPGSKDAQLAGSRPEPADLAWENTLLQIRKLIALDFHDNLPRELAKDKMVLLTEIEQRLERIEKIYDYNESFLRSLCKRNPDDLRTFAIASLIYIGGCLYEPITDDFEN